MDVSGKNELFARARALLHLNTIPERFGLVLVEANAAGVPVIATDLGSQIDARVGVSGEPIANKDTLDAFVGSMLLSLPLAVVLATLIAALVMRSFKYALAAIVPILLVVAWVYAFMFLTDVAINPITATIAAIAIVTNRCA